MSQGKGGVWGEGKGATIFTAAALGPIHPAVPVLLVMPPESPGGMMFLPQPMAQLLLHAFHISRIPVCSSPPNKF